MLLFCMLVCYNYILTKLHLDDHTTDQILLQQLLLVESVQNDILEGGN